MDGIAWLLSLASLLLAFVLLYPFYLREQRPTHYRGIWRAVGSTFRNRYGAIWVLNLYFGSSLSITVGSLTQSRSLRLLAWMLYFLIITPTLLWYPFHLKEKSPEKYKGIWRLIGEWLGDPGIAFPSRCRRPRPPTKP